MQVYKIGVPIQQNDAKSSEPSNGHQGPSQVYPEEEEENIGGKNDSTFQTNPTPSTIAKWSLMAALNCWQFLNLLPPC